MKKFIVFMLLIAFVSFTLLVGCGGSVPKPISQESIKLAVSQIKQQKGVLDAAVAQKNDTISLALTVNKDTTVEQAKELGDNFVRLTITFAKDGNPGKEIGTTRHTYLVTVTDPTGRIIVQGAKVSGNKNITW